MKRSMIANVVAASLVAFSGSSYAAGLTDDEVRIGVLTDLSAIYSDIEGPGAVAAAKMALARKLQY